MAEIVRLTPRQFNALRPLLVDLMLEEQRHYDHPQQSRDEIAQEMGRPFYGRERHFCGARRRQEAAGALLVRAL
jgi:hypothetical protein